MRYITATIWTLQNKIIHTATVEILTMCLVNPVSMFNTSLIKKLFDYIVRSFIKKKILLNSGTEFGSQGNQLMSDRNRIFNIS